MRISIKIFISLILTLTLAISSLPLGVGAATPTLKQKLLQKEQKVKQLKAQQEKLRKQLQEITQQYQDSYTKLVLIKEKVQRNKQKLDETSIELDLNQDKLNRRVVAMYKNNEDLIFLSLLLNFKSFQELISEIQFMAMVGKADLELVNETTRLRDQVRQKQYKLEKEVAKQKQALAEVEEKQNAMKRNLDMQNLLAQLLSQDISRLRKQTANVDGLSITIVFPVNGPHSFINDWGFPRSGGRRHRGNDIFAKTGTPTVAAADGYIGKASPVEKGLGGITLWVYGIDGNQYYYAHLSKIHPGIRVGSKVAAGQVIGHVGNSGNARTTPPHLHFQIHPGGGEPINPYPYLIAADPYQ